jgi:hypothetical protein
MQGPNIDPCGTPLRIVCQSDLSEFILFLLAAVYVGDSWSITEQQVVAFHTHKVWL